MNSLRRFMTGIYIKFASPAAPEFWTVVEGRLYLNRTEEIQAKWDVNRADFISSADLNWPGLRAKLSSGAE